MIAGLQHDLESHFARFEGDILDRNRSIQSAHIRVNYQPLFAGAAVGCGFENPCADERRAGAFSLGGDLAPVRLDYAGERIRFPLDGSLEGRVPLALLGLPFLTIDHPETHT